MVLHQKKNITQPLIEGDQYEGGQETRQQQLVRQEVKKIKGLRQGIEVPEDVKNANKSKFNCLFRQKHENFSAQETEEIIVNLFGNSNLEGGLNLNNIITYNQFSRIDNEIDEKNQRAERLIELHVFNWLVSCLGPAIFWCTLPDIYWEFFDSHKTSAAYVTIKILQCGVKFALLYELKNKLLKVEKECLTVNKEYVQKSKLFLLIDAIIEFMALGLICLLRRDIYISETCLIKQGEGEECANGVEVPDHHIAVENYFQADILWFTALLSIVFAFFYDLYLSKKLASDLDQCDFYHQKDQITYVTITNDKRYNHWKDASIQMDGKTIDRRLTSFELDQLFNHYGPVQISQYVNDFNNTNTLAEGIRKIEQQLKEQAQKLDQQAQNR